MPLLSRAEDKPPAPPKPADNANPDLDDAAWAEDETVQEIFIRGLVRENEGTVLRKIQTRKGRPFKKRTWDEDWHRLDESGLFLNVRTTQPQKWPGGVRLDIDVVEKATVSKVEFRGTKSVSDAKLLDLIKTHSGGKYDKGQVHVDKIAIEKYYQDKAYRGVKAAYQIETVASHRQIIATRELDVDDEVRVIFIVDEGSPVGVRVIKFMGNTAFTEAQLRATMQTKNRRLFRSGDLKDEDLDTDKKRLEAFYLRHGYMDVQIEKVEIDVTDQTYWNWFKKRKRLANVIITINEGPQYYAGKVNIAGNIAIALDEIQAVMKVRPGSVYSDQLLQDDSDRIKGLYGERGRVFTEVRIDRKLVTDPERTKKTPNLYDVEIAIKEGAEISLREVVTRGNTKTRDKVIIRELDLYPGDRIDTTKVREAVNNLKNLGYFSEDIRISPEATDNPEEANLLIDVQEKNTGEFQFGVGYSSVDSVLGNVKLSQHNFDIKDVPKSWRDLLTGNSFVGAGQTATLEAQGGTRKQRYQLSFFEPWAFDRPLRLGGSIFRTVDNYPDFRETNTGMSSSIGKRLWGRRWDGDLTYRFSFTEIGKARFHEPPILDKQQGSKYLSSVTPRIVYDSRDSHLLPTRGWLLEGSLELGGGPFGGTYNWVRPTFDVTRYLTTFKLKNGAKHILELHGRVAAVESYGNSDDIPPFMRYYAGGIDTIRGFKYRTIAPLENNFLIGGKRIAYGSAEYSVPLYEEIVRASAFVDAGSVFDAGVTDPHTIISNQSGLRISTGIGLSIRTPISPMPLRIYFSRPFRKNAEDHTQLIDFLFGTRF